MASTERSEVRDGWGLTRGELGPHPAARFRSRPPSPAGGGIRRAASPVFFDRRRVRRSPSRTPKNKKGARDASGPGAFEFTQNAQTKMLGPTGLDASRHRGMSSPDSRKSASPSASRARCLLGLFRNAPGGLTLSGAFPHGKAAYPPLLQPKWCPARLTMPAATVSGVAVVRGKRAGTTCGFDRRAAPPHLQRSVIPRPPLPAPHLKMLIRHPCHWGGM